MNLQVLMATMNQDDYSILEELNLQSDIIVCNQNKNKTSFNDFSFKDFNVKWYNFQEKGVGLNRNNALMRATADISLIGDDDVKYVDNYPEIICKAFEKNPKADVILFNIVSLPNENRYVCKKTKRINRLNCGKFGGVRIAFRTNSVRKNCVSFSLLFGGGTKYSSGEDNMFIRDCIRKGLKVIAVPDYILSLVDKHESTWFRGYNEKFFNDLGASYYYHFKKFAYMFSLIQLFRRRKKWLSGEIGFNEAKRYIKKGIKEFKCL